MILRCPDRENCCINSLICIYTCEVRVKECCPVYEKNYDKITAMLIEQKYLDKYGIPGHVLPKVRQPKKERKKRTTKQPVKDPAVALPAEKKARIVKAVKEVKAARVEPEVEEVKPKRTRRTKAEMEAAKKEGK